MWFIFKSLRIQASRSFGLATCLITLWSGLMNIHTWIQPYNKAKRRLLPAARTTLQQGDSILPNYPHQALKGGYFVFVWRVLTWLDLCRYKPSLHKAASSSGSLRNMSSNLKLPFSPPSRSHDMPVGPQLTSLLADYNKTYIAENWDSTSRLYRFNNHHHVQDLDGDDDWSLLVRDRD